MCSVNANCYPSPPGFAQKGIPATFVENNAELSKLNNVDTSITQHTISEEIIKARIYWLAADLVSQWRSLPAERWDLETVFQEFNPELKEGISEFTLSTSLLLNCLAYSKTSYSSLLVELEKNYSEQFNLLKNRGIVKTLVPVTVDITNFLLVSTEKCIQELQDNFESVTTKAYQNLEIHFYYLRDFGTNSVMDCMVFLIQELENLIKEYELKCQFYEDLIASSKQSFNNLSLQLLKWRPFSIKPTVESVFNALFVSYKLQLELKLYGAACQLLKMLKERVDKYTDSVAIIDKWLSELQSWFSLQYPLEPVNPTLLKDLSYRVEPILFRKEIEEYINLTLYEWNSLDETQLKDLKEQILSRVQLVCWEHYQESLLIKEKLSNRSFMKILEE